MSDLEVCPFLRGVFRRDPRLALPVFCWRLDVCAFHLLVGSSNLCIFVTANILISRPDYR